MALWTENEKPTSKSVKFKVALIIFFDYRDVVHHDFIPQGRAVDKEYYLAVWEYKPNFTLR